MGLGVVLLVTLAAARVTSTYHVFNQTADEPDHIAAGMEWLDLHKYLYEWFHPPLARIASATGPYWLGRHSQRKHNQSAEGLAILLDNENRETTLAAARAGILPFLVIAGLAVFAWGRNLSGEVGGLVALLLFTALPPVLAHSGLATTDAAATAFTALGILAFVRWVERQTIGRSVTLGATWALAAVSKFSALAFLPAAAAAIVIVRIAMTRRDVVAWRPRLSSKLVTQIGVAAATASIAIWATYLFKVDFPPALGGSVPVPALAFFRGIQSVLAHNTRGHHAYLLGRTSVTGWWYFFPVAVAVKTPLPFLALSIAGLLMLTLSATRLHDWRRSVVPVSAVTILAVVMSSNINIGVRHVLPIYVPLAVAAGCAVMTLWNSARARWVTRSTAVALVVWLEVSSVRAHPDYLAYFNELGGAHPEHVLIDSDLDWGQDFKRLVDTVRSHEIDSIGVVYWGSVDVEKEGTPGMRRLKPNERVTGWVAISELFLNGIYGSGYEWLQAYTPVLRVGKSVWLYHIPPTTDRP